MLNKILSWLGTGNKSQFNGFAEVPNNYCEEPVAENPTKIVEHELDESSTKEVSLIDFIKTVPYVEIEYHGTAMRITQCGTRKTVNTTKYCSEWRQLSQSWNKFTQNGMIEEYLNKLWVGDYLHLWRRHLLLVYIGKPEEALKMLREEARKECYVINRGLYEQAT